MTHTSSHNEAAAFGACRSALERRDMVGLADALGRVRGPQQVVLERYVSDHISRWDTSVMCAPAMRRHITWRSAGWLDRGRHRELVSGLFQGVGERLELACVWSWRHVERELWREDVAGDIRRWRLSLCEVSSRVCREAIAAYEVVLAGDASERAAYTLGAQRARLDAYVGEWDWSVDRAELEQVQRTRLMIHEDVSNATWRLLRHLMREVNEEDELRLAFWAQKQDDLTELLMARYGVSR